MLSSNDHNFVLLETASQKYLRSLERDNEINDIREMNNEIDQIIMPGVVQDIKLDKEVIPTDDMIRKDLKAKRAHTTGELIDTRSSKKKKKKATRLLTSPIIELKEVSDSDIELGSTIIINKRETTPDYKDEKKGQIGQVDLEQDYKLQEEIVVLNETDLEIDDLLEPTDITQEITQIDEASTKEPSFIVEAESTQNNVMIAASPSRQKKKSKSLKEICLTTSRSYLKPRIGLSRRSNIQSLHGYLKKRNL